MQQYLDLVRNIIDNGSWQDNRTGVRTISLPGMMMKFDLARDGFPVITTRKMAFKAAVGEMIGFLRGANSAADFRALGCKVWDQNANENAQWLANPFRAGEDDLGEIYGVQWRRWPAYRLIGADETARIEASLKQGFRLIGPTESDGKPSVLLYKPIDQLRECLDTIMTNPGSRRILFHGWNCAQIETMALPPCHLLYQFHPNVTRRELSMTLYIRSNDIGLGAGFNLIEGATLLSLVARLTGYEPRWFTYFIGDAHIYENHLEMLAEQLRRKPLAAPQLVISDRVPQYAKTREFAPQWLEMVEPGDFSLRDYEHHAPLTAPMAV